MTKKLATPLKPYYFLKVLISNTEMGKGIT